jgi:hypothetical protein
MKTVKFFWIILLFFGVMLVSCEKKSDTVNPVGGGSVSLKVNGESWSATLAVQAVKGAQGLVTLTGSDANAKQVSFTLMNAQAVGTYTIGGLTNPNQGRWTQSTSASETFLASMVLGSGEVKITEYSDSGFKGTFQFEAYNTDQVKVNITDGQFEASF